jgi:putative ABC transport system permease protein
LVKAREGIANEELKDELRGAMRNIRSQHPREEDNFSLNQISLITNQIGSIFGVVDVVGLIRGGFAILVGGFGIANIMFVSVKERTNIIGIKKALGAKNYFILLEFLIESVVLSVIGGLLGLLLVYLVTLWANSVIPFKFTLDANNIFLGISISAAIGVISGFLPALSASRLDPVEAIRSK